MLKSSREYYNIEDVCKMFDMELPDHITVNPKLNRREEGQYDIVRQTTHDGTMLFTRELLGRTIENIINKASHYTANPPNKKVTDIKYEVGLISLATVYGNVELPAGNYPGEKQRARMSVKCTLIQ